MKIKYKLTIEYFGSLFSGMQKQEGKVTVQGILEDALSTFFDEQITINYAGRTDAGVHAVGQVVDFVSTKKRDLSKVVLGLNFFLKKTGIVCTDASVVEMEFDSRFSATERHYVYKIINRRVALTFLEETHLHISKKINTELLKVAASCFVGMHDFSMFRNIDCQAKSPIKTINSIRVEEIFSYTGFGTEIHIFVSARSFLYNMVRRMVGTMVDVSTGQLSIEDLNAMLQNNSSKTARTVRPNGLYLLRVDY